MTSGKDPDVSEDVPEADALEQRRAVADDEEVEEAPHLGSEVPEADALEQARAVPLDEDEEHDAG